MIDCRPIDEIREYLRDKTIVVFATESYVEDEVIEANNRKVISSLTPIIEKRLDFASHKEVKIEVVEHNIEIQDLLLQIFEPER